MAEIIEAVGLVTSRKRLVYRYSGDNNRSLQAKVSTRRSVEKGDKVDDSIVDLRKLVRC